ncbi:TPA: hypothetical protein ACX6RX_003151 [Photobacterium damselae]
MKEYMEMDRPPFNLDELTVTDLVRDTLYELMRDISLRLYYSPSRLWGASSKNELVGGWLIRIGYENKYSQVKKIHGRVINTLFNSGLIEVDKDLTEKKRCVFMLSEAAINNVRSVKQKVMFDDRQRVQWDELESLAELYGVKIEFQQARGLFKLSTLNGKSFRPDEYILSNPRGLPVKKLNDMTWVEWEELLHECSIMISKN